MTQALRDVMLQYAKELSFPLDAVTQKFAIMGQSGGGKTYDAMKLAELMLEAGAQIVVADIPGVWKGLRSSADGKSPGFKVLLVGGEDGDLPINASSGALIADMVVDTRLSVILDLSEMDDDDMLTFMIAFTTRLFKRKKSPAFRDPMHLFLEECQELIPQELENGLQKLLRAKLVRMMKIGRNYGIGWSAITQEPQAASKRAINQAGTIIAVRTMGGHERKALEAWARSKTKSKEQLALMDVLPELEQGQALVWSPGWLKHAGIVNILPKVTFDSSATPKMGERKIKARVIAELDLVKLKADMASLVQKAEAEDPALLQKKIAEQAREIATLKKAVPIAPAAPGKTTVRQEKVVITKDAQSLHAAISRLEILREKTATQRTAWEAAEFELAARIRLTSDELQVALKAARVVDEPTKRVEVSKPLIAPTPMTRAVYPGTGAARVEMRPPPMAVRITPHTITEGAGEVKIGTGEQRMLDVLANQHPKALTKKQLAIMSGFTMKGGTFRTYLPKLRTIGLVTGGTGGDSVSLTEAGCAAAASAMKQGPRSAEQIQAMWRNTLGTGEQKLLDVVIAVYPAEITREDLGKEAGFDVDGGTFRTYLPKLHTLGLIEYGSGKGAKKLIRAADTLVQPEAA